ncbi:unnamed protein product, partial [marine sediment metagenome]
DVFATKTVSQQITSDISDQVEPAIAADSGNTVYVVWTDTRNNGKKDIYGAASNNGPWTNVAVVTEDDGQSSPAIATEAVGPILHLVWVDDRPGDDKLYVAWQDNRQADYNNQGDWDIYISTSDDGMNWSDETRVNDPNNDNQANPAIVVDSNLPSNNAYIVWEDDRNGNQDIYVATSSDVFATKTVFTTNNL